MASLYFGKKQVKFSKPYQITDNKEVDFNHFQEFFKGVQGKNPDLF